MTTPITTMPAAFAAKEALLNELVSPSLIGYEINGAIMQHPILPDPFFHPLNQVEDIEIAHIPGPIGHSALLVRGRQGAHQMRVRMAQAVRIHVLSGQLILWLPEHQQMPYVFQQGEQAELSAGLEHGFVVATDCLLYNIYTPAFQLIPPPPK